MRDAPTHPRPLVLQSFSLRIDPLWRCPCGRPLKAYDFAVDDEGGLENVTCSGCHRQLLTIERG